MAYNNQRPTNQRPTNQGPTNQRPTNQGPTNTSITDLSGKEVRVFVKDFGNRISSSTTISHKTKEGEYEDMLIVIEFAKFTTPTAEGVHIIKINNGFWSCYYSKKYETMLPKIVILDYEEI